jgi:signal transduction histidine kinase/ActR/RegA family two-component response regulator
MTPDTHGTHDTHTTIDGWMITDETVRQDPSGHLASMREVPFGLLVIDLTRGTIMDMNRAAEALLGVVRAAGESPSFADLVAGDGAALLRNLRDIGAGQSSRFAFRRATNGAALETLDAVDASDGLIHGWAHRVELAPWSLAYCALLRPDRDLGGAEPEPARWDLLGKVVTAAPDIVYVQDLRLRRDIFIGGGWRCLGYSRDELRALGGPFLEVLAHPADRAAAAAPRESDGADWVGPSEREIRVRHRDGGYRLLRCRETPARWTPEQGPRELVGYAEDITEQRAQLALMRESEVRARARAAELEMAAVRLSVADRRKDEFLARLAHELRNPLAPIRIWTQRLLGASETPALVRHASEVVDRQVRHLTRLVEDLLEVSRFVWGKVALRQEPVALGEAVELAVQMAQPLIEERRHELTLALGTEVVWVRGDLARLVEIFHNLLDNAAKYTPASGHIRLTLSAQPPEAVVVVKDDGIGIDPEFMPRVFDLFSRGPHAEQLPAGGLGLGLSLVHQMVLAHGGSVSARSGGSGQGSEFEVRLPLADAPERTVRAHVAVGPVGGAHYNILVVDDNPDGAEALASYLKDLGHKVEVAGDGKSGLALAERFRPQFVLLDIGMPGMDGHELARRLRAEPWAGAVVLLAISGYDSEDDRQRSLAAGCDEHLVKPVDPETILDLLARYGAGGRGVEALEAPGSEQHR